MTKLFISYRRQDSAGWTGRLFDGLNSRYGMGQVFLDIANIEPGVDFNEHITKAVAASDAVVAVIGPDWLRALHPSTGQRRLDDSQDGVRMQLAKALELKKPVVPVLVGGAAMPRAQDLPRDIQGLAERQAVEMRASSWESDFNKLSAILDRTGGRRVTRWFRWRS